VNALDIGRKQLKRFRYDALFLAAGTLSSLRVAADSQHHHLRSVPLLDNDLYLVPFMRTTGTGKPPERLRFTLNELSLRVSIRGHFIHIQLYCMSDQIIDRFRPLFSIVPRFLRRRLETLLARLKVAFIYLPGDASAPTEAAVRPGATIGTVHLKQRRHGQSAQTVRQLLRHLARSRRALGLRRVGPAVRSAPAGPGGGHLVGSLPMNHRPGPLQTYPDGRLYGTHRVFVVDGAALPSLPAQNPTYTIMANAHRIGAEFAKRQTDSLT
jgi:choline dehydrogenase-like flavoprotein